MMKETAWRFYHDHGWRYKIKAEYGIDYHFARRHNQQPYYSITGETRIQARNNRWMDDSGGQLHGLIERYFPHLAPSTKWHLVGPEGPTHYFENARYWFNEARGSSKNSSPSGNAVINFKSTIVLGAFPGDRLPPDLAEDFEHWRPPKEYDVPEGPKEWRPGQSRPKFNARWEDVRAWLEERLPDLQAAWAVDMAELGVLEE